MLTTFLVIPQRLPDLTPVRQTVRLLWAYPRYISISIKQSGTGVDFTWLDEFTKTSRFLSDDAVAADGDALRPNRFFGARFRSLWPTGLSTAHFDERDLGF